MKRLAFATIFILTFGIFLLPAAAQYDWDGYDWVCVFDFTQSNGGWTTYDNYGQGTSANYVASTGWRSNAGDSVLSIRYVLPADTDITGLGATFIYQWGYGGNSSPLYVHWDDPSSVWNGSSIGGLHFSGATNSSSPVSQTVFFTAVSAEQIGFYISYGGASSQQTLQSYSVYGLGSVPISEGTGIDCETIPVVTDYIKPIAANQVDNDWDEIETYAAGSPSLSRHTMLQFSDAPGTPVQAPIGGTITNIYGLDAGTCTALLGTVFGTTLAACNIIVHEGLYSLGISFSETLTSKDVVEITTDTGVSFLYIVKNARNYISEGLVVTPECWIGETFELIGIVPSVGLDVSVTPGDSGKSAVIWRGYVDNVPTDLVDQFNLEGNGDAPCNREPGYEQCVGDADFTLDDWTVVSGTVNNGVAYLQPHSGTISTLMNLNAALEPRMQAKMSSSTGIADMQLGDLTTRVVVDDSYDADGIYEIPGGVYNPDNAGLYTIKISNAGNSAIVVEWVCISFTKDDEGDPVDPPGGGPPGTPSGNGSACVFLNNSFNSAGNGPTGWTLASSIETAPGEIRVRNSSVFSQVVTTSSPGSFALSLTTQLWTTAGATITPTTSATVIAEYSYPASTTWTQFDSTTITDYVDNTTVTLSGNISVNSAITSKSFVIRVRLVNTPTNLTGIRVLAASWGGSNQFSNSSFDTRSTGPDNWSVTGTNTTATGEIRLASTATLGQEVTLQPGQYTLTVVTKLWVDGTYTAAPDDPDEVTLEYNFPYSSSWVTVDEITYGDFADNETQIFEQLVTVSSATTGTFVIRPTLASPPTGALGLTITAICLNDGSGTGLDEKCEITAEPSGSDVGTWTQWLWLRLNEFFRCELMLILRDIFNAILDIFNLMGWMMRWWMAFIANLVDWFTQDFIDWLGGHYYNIAVGTIYVVEGNESQADISANFGDAIGGVIADALGQIIGIFVDLLRRFYELIWWIINIVFNLLLYVVLALIALGIIIIGYIFQYAAAFIDVIVALFQSWNASTPQPISGLPLCAVQPKEQPVCIAMWTLEHTVFSGRGYLLIPIFVGYYSFTLLLWVVRQIKKQAEKSATNI